FGKVKGGEDGYRAYARHFSSLGKTYTLVILQSLHPQEEMLEEVTSTFAWVIPVAILLAGVGGYFLARQSLAPVVAMSSQAGRVGVPAALAGAVPAVRPRALAATRGSSVERGTESPARAYGAMHPCGA